MNCSVLRQSVLFAVLALLAHSSGCDRHAAIKQAALEDASPEARYKRIMESFRRKIDGQPVGFVIAQGNSRTTMTGSNKVTSELIKPTTPEGHYKAVVLVTTQSHYSLRRTKTEDADQNNKHKNNSGLDDPKEKEGVGILESDLAGPKGDAPQPPSGKPLPPEDDVITRRSPPQEVRKYELVDDGQHWTLITKLDGKTEQSIQFAFDDALARQ